MVPVLLAIVSHRFLTYIRGIPLLEFHMGSLRTWLQLVTGMCLWIVPADIVQCSPFSLLFTCQ